MTSEHGWIRVCSPSDIPIGESHAVKIDAGRSIALFNQNGKIFATDNQCPHMGYPLTRGVVNGGVLTCDWHGRSFDLEGGGCFNYECDDLETFVVEIREGGVWVELGDGTYKRKDQHLRLLWEGLLSRDSWTISKAIALLLSGGVSENNIVELILRHLGRHIATSRGAEEGGEIISLLISGLKVGKRYEGEDRLMALSLAGRAASGSASDRLDVIALPPPVTWVQLEGWIREFSRNMQDGRIERCLYTARENNYDDKIFKLLYECAVAPHYLGFPRNLTYLSDLAEVVNEFGWVDSSELVCNLAAKMIGQGRAEPESLHREALRLMADLLPDIESHNYELNTKTDFNERALVEAILSVNIDRAFKSISEAVHDGVSIQRLITSFVLLAADRMARTPVDVDAGWGALSTEFNLAASLRIAYKYGGPSVAAKGLFHAAWLTFSNRWINIPLRDLQDPLSHGELTVSNAEQGTDQIVNSIRSLNVHGVTDEVLGYLGTDFSSNSLLKEIGGAVLWDDTNLQLLSTLRAIFDEWDHVNSGDVALGDGHPARHQLLVGLARYATDVRLNKNSVASINTAMRFSEGRTTAEVFDT